MRLGISPRVHSRIEGWGWVAEMSGRFAGCSHPLEKSVPGFVGASIHRLVEETLRRIVRTRN